MVRSWTGWNLLSVNCNRRHDLPTPVTYVSLRLYVAERLALAVSEYTLTCVSDDDVFKQIRVRHDDT